MSLQNDRERYLALYNKRSSHAWAPPPDSQAFAIDHWSDRILIVASGPIFGTQIESMLDRVEERESAETWSCTGAITKNMGGYFHDKKVTVIHSVVTPYGAGSSYIDYVMERLRR